ncbi:MAG: acyl-CoA dehydrogenase family protein, partial [Bacteroidia bacterium]
MQPHFQESESTHMVRQTVRDFAEKQIRPHVMEWDEAQTFPRPLFHQLGELGLMGVLVPEAYGGSGLGYLEYVAAIEELAQVCGSIGLSMAAHNSLCTGHIL